MQLAAKAMLTYRADPRDLAQVPVHAAATPPVRPIRPLREDHLHRHVRQARPTQAHVSHDGAHANIGCVRDPVEGHVLHLLHAVLRVSVIKVHRVCQCNRVHGGDARLVEAP